MGRALVRDPKVFLLDEPLSNLDANLRAKIRSDIVTIQKRIRKTTLYVTHDQVEAMTLGDRVAVIKQGKLQQVATPEELYQRPHNIFVAEFIGNPGMNILPGKVISANKNALRLVIENQTIELNKASVQIFDPVAGQSLFIGIRPEAIHPEKHQGDITLDVIVERVEFLGAETLVFFRMSSSKVSEKPMIARVTGRPSIPINTQTELYANAPSFYLFNEHGINKTDRKLHIDVN